MVMVAIEEQDRRQGFTFFELDIGGTHQGQRRGGEREQRG